MKTVFIRTVTKTLAASVFLASIGCGSPNTPPIPGPDKQGGGMLSGMVTGAGAGAVTGFQLSAATGPGAAVGAGFGAVAGSIQGAVQDSIEEENIRLAREISKERTIARVHQIVQDHYKRRIQLHPSRDIFPADLFFNGDESTLRPQAIALVKEIASLNKNRMSWSRLVIAAYVKSNDEDAEFPKTLAEKRAREIGDYFVRNGIEPRRIEARAVVIPAPLVIDPLDHPARYNQAIELIPLDR